MSAFLGPIHHWLYNKINLQDNLTEQFLQYAEKNNMNDIRSKVDAAFGKMPEGNLEDIIDEGNIHGWLQSKIILVENRYAMTVIEILGHDSDAISSLEAIAKQFGETHSPLTAASSAAEAFQLLNDSLIDGMPCDHVNQLIDQNVNEVTWKRTQCVHGHYWIENGGNPEVYYQIRDQFVRGLLAPSNATFESNANGIYKIVK